LKNREFVTPASAGVQAIQCITGVPAFRRDNFFREFFNGINRMLKFVVIL
jgi:hypothetical protein